MLKNRLLSIGVLLFLFGIVITVFISGTILPLCIVAVSVLCILLCTVRFFKLNMAAALIFSLLPALGAIYVIIYGNLFVMPFSVFDGAKGDMTAKVISVSNSGYDISLIESDVGVPSGTKIRVYSEDRPMVGDIVSFYGKLKYAKDKTLIASDVKLMTNVYKCEISPGSGLIYKFRKTAYNAFDTLPQKYGSFLKAIIFNDKASLGEERYSMYRIAGAASFFAVSGLHISFIAMTLYYVLAYFGVGKTTCGIFAVASAVFYGTLAGFTPSVVRAIIMIAFIMLAQILSAEADTTTSLFFALGVLLLINPYSAASLGLQLSFSATLGAIYSAGVFSLKSKKRPIISALVGIFVIPSFTSATCFVFTYPILFTSFDVISIASPISNIFLSIIFTPLLIFAFLIILLALCALPVISVIRYPAMFLINIFDMVCDIMSSKIKLLLPTNNIFAAVVAVLAVIAFLSVLVLSKKKRRIVFFASCILMLSVFFGGMISLKHQNQSSCKLAYKQFRDGYSVIAICDGEKYYIDHGDFDGSFVYSQNITEIDAYVIQNVRNEIVSDISYAIRRFGVKKIVLISNILNDDIYKLATDYEIPFYIETEINIGNVTSGIVIDKNHISLYNRAKTFYIANGGTISEDADLDGLIIATPAVIFDKKQIHKCANVFLDENITTENELSRFFTRLERNMSVVASCEADNIEVTVNES